MARDEATRLRSCREAFELSMARGIPMERARHELAKSRWEESEARLARKRCGTRDETTPAKPQQPTVELWWQRESL